ncbi:casein kinase II subunit beta [Sporothrix brasiliensis 5110]|uniref:Casein kinase II subunit beta n=1 Tax=Sporothrix brasiliensis 5110 TaxID=1398154 RepID=A0A0C2JBH2_9PEZI|nr:casein kinase II subunit beta [Sporothrix brasiliensis 5110]KIH94212.1 casein kinase II subunit beta [Sporothrix brasiliensis 5110]
MSTSSGTPETWIASFCSLLGHEYFAEVSEDFIEDDFNLTGLQSQVQLYKEALEMILDVEPEDDEDDEEEDDDDEENETGEERMRHTGERRNHSRMPSDLSMIEGSAELLYGLIHQRFICSRAGIQQMSEKYELSHFGVCPRTYCNLARTLPVGLSDIPGEDTVKLFCPSCLDVYVPPNSRFQTVDGAFFGRTFGALFLLTFPEYDLTKNGVEALTTVSSLYAGQSGGSPTVNGIYARNTAPGLGHGKIFEPKIYGFRVSERARSGPRMQWLRSKPDDIAELDETRRHNAAEQQHHDGADSDGDVVQESDSDAANGDRSTGVAGSGRRPPPADGGTTQLQLARSADGSTGLPSDAQLRQHQNGSPMTVDANGVESEL